MLEPLKQLIDDYEIVEEIIKPVPNDSQTNSKLENVFEDNIDHAEVLCTPEVKDLNTNINALKVDDENKLSKPAEDNLTADEEIKVLPEENRALESKKAPVLKHTRPNTLQLTENSE